jgi:hypothetical protein
MRAYEMLISAESSFCQRVGGALRLIGSFIAAPAVTGVLGPDMPGGRSGVLVAHAGTIGGYRSWRLRPAYARMFSRTRHSGP